MLENKLHALHLVSSFSPRLSDYRRFFSLLPLFSSCRNKYKPSYNRFIDLLP